MQIAFLKSKFPVLAVIILAALFLISIFLGFEQGKAQAQASSVYQNVQQLGKGLDNFFSDQNRFPSLEEFSDTNILLTYFSRLPDNTSANSTCSENFIYNRPSLTGYQLSFCLAAGTAGFQKGWNTINEQKQ